MRLMRAFRWMAAASRKERRIAVIHAATRAHSVRETTNVFAMAFKAGDSSKDVKILILRYSSPCSVPNCVLSKELLTDGLKVLVSKEDELLYAARVHTLELPDM